MSLAKVCFDQPDHVFGPPAVCAEEMSVIVTNRPDGCLPTCCTQLPVW